MKPLLMLVYTSQEAVKMDLPALESILNSAMRHNSQDSITGFLIFRSGYFIQLLEGPEDAVLQSFERIAKDSRHKNVILQGQSPIEKRIMADWSMGYVDLENSNSIEGVLDLFEMARRGEPFSSPQSLESTLRFFSRGAKILPVGSIKHKLGI